MPWLQDAERAARQSLVKMVAREMAGSFDQLRDEDDFDLFTAGYILK